MQLAMSCYLDHVQGVSTTRPFDVMWFVKLWLNFRIFILFVENILTKVFIRVGSLFLWFPMIYYLIGHLRKHGDLRLIKNAIGHLTLIN